MPEFLFNTETGRLYVGAKAAEPDIAEFGPKIVPLAGLLELDSLPFPTEHFGRLNTRNWEAPDYYSFGHWAVSVLAQNNPGSETPILQTHHMRRLCEMGIGPSRSGRFRRLFGGFDAFKLEAGLPALSGTEIFKHWAIADFVDFARKLAKRLGRRPIDQDYDALYRDRMSGPGLQMIRKRVGGVRKLNEYAGYPNVCDWEEYEFVLWGVKVLRANPTKGVTVPVINTLSGLDRGPGTSTIIDHFKKLTIFQSAVVEELRRQDQQAALDLARKVSAYKSMISRGQLDPSYEDAPTPKLLAVGARRLLIQKCAPNIPEPHKQTLAGMQPKTLIEKLVQAVPGLNTGKIEVCAVTLDVFDDIWPIDNSIEDLCVDLA